MKRVQMWFVVGGLILLLFGCTNSDRTITITTGGTGGTYYPVGGTIAQMLTDHIDGLKVNAYVGNASIDNCNLIKEGSTDSALVQNNVAYWASEGLGAFENNQVSNLRGITSLYPEAIQIVALKSAGIKSVEDLVGKKVSVGVGGSGVNFDAKHVLEAHGLTFDDITAFSLSFNEAAEQMKEGKIDAAFVTAGFPTSSVMDVHLNKDIILIPIAEKFIEALTDVFPYYSQTIIPADTYPGIDYDIKTITTMAIWAVDEKVDTKIVYEMTKTLWENRAELETAHEKGKEITLETALDGMSIELHEGAKQYYREVGLK